VIEIVAKLPNEGELKKEINTSKKTVRHKAKNDSEISAIIRGESDRLLLIIGPCSADDPAAVLEYAAKLSEVAKRVHERVCVVMRVFTAKPRTACTGYMGLLHEPNGIETARRLHLAVQEQTGLPTADELLYPATLSYFDDIINYYAIGARSSENQEHRLVASGLDAACGIKNPPSGDLRSMINAVTAAKAPHDFLFDGHIVQSGGNKLAHGILRGGVEPNYSRDNLLKLRDMGLSSIIVDVNHANSMKCHSEQPKIAMEVLKNQNLIKGLMIESYIEDGAAERGKQAFGQSITDPCLGFDATEKLIYEIADKL